MCAAAQLVHSTSEDERWIATFTILTTAANDDTPIHDRLPLIMERDVWERGSILTWDDVDELETLIRVASPGVLRYYPVDRQVGSIKNDDPSCTEHVELRADTLC